MQPRSHKGTEDIWCCAAFVCVFSMNAAISVLPSAQGTAAVSRYIPLLITNKQTNKQKLNSALQSVSWIFTCWNKLEFLNPFVCRGRLKGQNADRSISLWMNIIPTFWFLYSKIKNEEASFGLIGAWVTNRTLSWFVDAQLFSVILALLAASLFISSALSFVLVIYFTW